MARYGQATLAPSLTRAAVLVPAVLMLALPLAGCGDTDRYTGADPTPEVGEVTVVSDDSKVTTRPLCTGDIPDDYTTCPDAPANLGQLELDDSRHIGITVPSDVAAGGWRVRINGQPVSTVPQPINEPYQPLVIPPAAVEGSGETVLTVEALRSPAHAAAVWQFLLDDPA